MNVQTPPSVRFHHVNYVLDHWRTVKCLLGTGLIYRLDARSVPSVMANLTFMEKRFIAQIHIFDSSFSSCWWTVCTRWTCINFPVDFQELYQDLDSQHDKDIIIVKPASSTASENSQIGIENVIRKTVLQHCLMWLKKHNRHYSDMNISMCTAKITHVTPELLESREQASWTQISFTPTNYVPTKAPVKIFCDHNVITNHARDHRCDHAF